MRSVILFILLLTVAGMSGCLEEGKYTVTTPSNETYSVQVDAEGANVTAPAATPTTEATATATPTEQPTANATIPRFGGGSGGGGSKPTATATPTPTETPEPEPNPELVINSPIQGENVGYDSTCIVISGTWENLDPNATIWFAGNTNNNPDVWALGSAEKKSDGTFEGTVTVGSCVDCYGADEITLWVFALMPVNHEDWLSVQYRPYDEFMSFLDESSCSDDSVTVLRPCTITPIPELVINSPIQGENVGYDSTCIVISGTWENLDPNATIWFAGNTNNNPDVWALGSAEKKSDGTFEGTVTVGSCVDCYGADEITLWVFALMPVNHEDWLSVQYRPYDEFMSFLDESSCSDDSVTVLRPCDEVI